MLCQGARRRDPRRQDVKPRRLLHGRPGQITRYPLPVPELPGSEQLPEPEVPDLNSDSDFDYPKLVWVIRVISPGTRTTRITQIFVYIFIFIMCC